MSTHSLTLNLDEVSHRILQDLVLAGKYQSESEAIVSLLPLVAEELAFLQHQDCSTAELLQDVREACDQADNDPESLLTGDQVLAFLKERHARDAA